MWTGEVKDYKGWYTQFSAYCSTLDEGEAVITLLKTYKAGPISAAEMAKVTDADAFLWSQLAQAMKPNHARFVVVEDNPWKGLIVLSSWEQYVYGEEARSKSAVWTALMSATRDVDGGETINDWIDRVDHLCHRLTTMGESVPDGVKIPIIKRIGVADRRVLTAGSSTLATETYNELKIRLTRIDREMGTEEADMKRGDVAMGTAARRTEGKCNYCKRPGHLEAVCRKKIADRSAGSDDGNGRGGGGRGGGGRGRGGGGGGNTAHKGACHNCGKEGHFARDCKRPKKVTVAAAAKGAPADDSAKGDGKDRQFAGVTKVFSVGEPRPSTRSRDMLTMDSAATSSLFNDARCFDYINPTREIVENANGEMHPMVVGVGRARYTVQIKGGGSADICVENAKFAPGCWLLQSESQLKSKGHGFSNLHGEPFRWFLPGGAGEVVVTSTDGLYHVPYVPAGRGGFDDTGKVSARLAEHHVVACAAAGPAQPLGADLWHERTGHPGNQNLIKISKCVDGMKVRGATAILDKVDEDSEIDVMEDGSVCPTCAVCKARKHARSRLPADQHVADAPMQRVFVDIAVMPCESLDGYKYVMIFVDDYSNAVFDIPMKLKTDAVACLRKFQAHYARIGTVQYWRTDGERTLTTTEMGGGWRSGSPTTRKRCRTTRTRTGARRRRSGSS